MGRSRHRMYFKGQQGEGVGGPRCWGRQWRGRLLVMPSMGQPSQGSCSEIARVCSSKPGWCKERSAYSLTAWSCGSICRKCSTLLPLFLFVYKYNLKLLHLAQGPSAKVRFVLGHRLALVFRLRRSVRGDRSSLVWLSFLPHSILNNGCATAGI